MILLSLWSKKLSQLQNQKWKKRRMNQYQLQPQLLQTQCQQLSLNLLLKPNPQLNHSQLPKLNQCRQKWRLQ